MIIVFVVLLLMVGSAVAGAYGYHQYLVSGFGPGAQLGAATQARLDALEAAQRLSATAWQTERQMYESALFGKKSRS